MLSFIKKNADSSILSADEKYQVVRVYKDVQDTDSLVIKKNTGYAFNEKQNQALLRFENILGEMSQRTHTDLIQATVLRRGLRVSTEVFNSTSTSNDSWPLAINTKQVEEPGVHVLKVSLNKTDVLEERFTVKTTVRVRNIEFEITQGKGKIPKKYTHSFNERSKKGIEKISANQNSFIFVQFSLAFVENDAVHN